MAHDPDMFKRLSIRVVIALVAAVGLAIVAIGLWIQAATARDEAETARRTALTAEKAAEMERERAERQSQLAREAESRAEAASQRANRELSKVEFIPGVVARDRDGSLIEAGHRFLLAAEAARQADAKDVKIDASQLDRATTRGV